MVCPPIVFPETLLCSGHGSCNGSSSVCVCDDPGTWMGTSDFVAKTYQACQVHRPSLLALNVLATISCTVASVVFVVWAKHYFKRFTLRSKEGMFAISVGLSSIFFTITCVLRLAYFGEKFIGVDVLTTVLWLLGSSAFWLETVLFLFLIFERLDKLVAPEFAIQKSLLRGTSRGPVLICMFALEAIMRILSASLSLTANSESEMSVATAFFTISIPVFRLIWLIYYGLINRVFLNGIERSTSPAKAHLRRRLLFGFFYFFCLSIVMGLTLLIMGMWKGIQVAWFGHVMSLSLCSMGTLSLLLMWLEKPSSHASTFLSQVDTGRSTDWVQLPKFFAKHSLFNCPVSKLPTVFEEGTEETGWIWSILPSCNNFRCTLRARFPT